MFQLVIDWINRTQEKAKYVESLMESKYIENTKLIKDSRYFKERIEIERRRKKEFGMEYCILSYRVMHSEFSTLYAIAKKTLRAVDLAYYNQNKQVITFLLPATKKENAALIEEKIKANFSDILVKIDLDPLEEGVS